MTFSELSTTPLAFLSLYNVALIWYVQNHLTLHMQGWWFWSSLVFDQRQALSTGGWSRALLLSIRCPREAINVGCTLHVTSSTPEWLILSVHSGKYYSCYPFPRDLFSNPIFLENVFLFVRPSFFLQSELLHFILPCFFWFRWYIAHRLASTSGSCPLEPWPCPARNCVGMKSARAGQRPVHQTNQPIHYLISSISKTQQPPQPSFIMPTATTISEALDTLPSSTTFPPSSPRPTRRILLTSARKKFQSSTPAETHRPAGLNWVPSHPQHLLSQDAWRNKGNLNLRVKETILITGRDAGVKQC